MRLRFSSIVPFAAALVLAGCGGAQEGETGEPSAQVSPDEVPVMGPERHIVAFGDSLFAGYGLGPGESYPERLQAALRARGINAQIANAGVSGDTTAAGRQRIAFTLDAQEKKPDLVIVELGGNDLLRSIDPAQTRENLAAILDEITDRDIPVLLMGMRAPPNLGPDYQQRFDALYGDIARQYGAELVPFFLEAIYQRPELFQDDRIHPTAVGIEEIVGATVSQVAEALPDAANDN
ncbi:arylesterase [Qipengyuania oceanensis]|uniref:Arylesterase n=1 Tax=Qipengyuania oceanensis TaxID=1463597 RepID=A0A844YFS1_9SPHN|nr:arylesterase [Qipengyuania oceanensis]MXO62199.1 arylesterase [Qipengyuania oceanensis]